MDLEKLRDKTVTLKGTARDAKAGAVILIEDNVPIYIRGLHGWPDELFGMQVSVSGLLKLVKLIPDPVMTEDGGHSTGAWGKNWVLENAEYEEIK